MAALRGERQACDRGGRSVDAQNNRPKWRFSACFRSNSDVPQKNDGNASSRSQKSSTIIQKYKVVQLFPKFIASVPTPLLKR